MARPSNDEIRELGRRIAEAAGTVLKVIRPDLPYLGGGAMNHDGIPVHFGEGGRPEVTFGAYSQPQGRFGNAFYEWKADQPLPLTVEQIGAVLAGALAGSNDAEKEIRKPSESGRRFTIRLTETGTERVETLEGRSFTVRDLQNLLVVYLPEDAANDKDRCEAAVHAWCQAAEEADRVVLFAVEGENYRVEAFELPDAMREGK